MLLLPLVLPPRIFEAMAAIIAWPASAIALSYAVCGVVVEDVCCEMRVVLCG